LKIRIFNRGFHYAQDGRGNRLVIHMQGCNLRCPWCTNPEGLESGGVLMRKGENRRPRNFSEEWELEDLLKLCRESAALFFDGGGVTFTGGEPTVQAAALRQALALLHEAGIHTAVETNGTSPLLPELFPLIDQLIMDFKTADIEKHRNVLGPGGELLVKNIRSALESHPDFLIRFPLIRGFNTSDADLADFLSVIGEGPVPRGAFEFLAYHEFGVEKWRQCGLEYRQKEAYVPAEVMRHFEEAFRSRQLQVVHT
jgi:pyruvate formate lyase activating enzyme